MKAAFGVSLTCIAERSFAMNEQGIAGEPLSLWWKRSVTLILAVWFAVLLWLAAKGYRDAPPIPEKVVSPAGELIFTGEDILAGQQVFLKYGLMENGTIWGHGAYLGPDFSAEYLPTLAVDTGEIIANRRYNKGFGELAAVDRDAVSAEVQRSLKLNRYDPQIKTLRFTESEAASFLKQIAKWKTYFSHPAKSAGLPLSFIHDSNEIRQLTVFFAWTAWASVANRPAHTTLMGVFALPWALCL